MRNDDNSIQYVDAQQSIDADGADLTPCWHDDDDESDDDDDNDSDDDDADESQVADQLSVALTPSTLVMPFP